MSRGAGAARCPAQQLVPQHPPDFVTRLLPHTMFGQRMSVCRASQTVSLGREALIYVKSASVGSLYRCAPPEAADWRLGGLFSRQLAALRKQLPGRVRFGMHLANERL